MMILTLHENADVASATRALASLGLQAAATERNARGIVHLVIGSVGVQPDVDRVREIDEVAEVSESTSAHPRVDAHGPLARVAALGGARVADRVVGATSPALMSGPCAVESEEQIHRIARDVAKYGATFLRGGAFKPRTSPYSFQGCGRDALRWLQSAAHESGMLVVTEVMSEQEVDVVAEHAELLQVGTRNMYNYALLKAVGGSGRAVLLKRSMSATIEEWLLAGEYLLAHGAASVIFCERGIRGFDASTRNLLDLGAVALLSHSYGLPVVVDPSHAVGRRDLVMPLARAAFAAGAAGVMIETHDDPANARSDGAQAVAPRALGSLSSFLAPPAAASAVTAATTVTAPARAAAATPIQGPAS
jgi:3-deoxy-7-phosphoheptulonate synthase